MYSDDEVHLVPSEYNVRERERQVAELCRVRHVYNLNMSKSKEKF